MFGVATPPADVTVAYVNGRGVDAQYVGDVATVRCASATALMAHGEAEYNVTCGVTDLVTAWNGTHNYSVCYGG